MLQDRAIDDRRLKELFEFFHPFDTAHDHGRRLSTGRGARYQQEGDADSAAWSGVPQTGVDDPQMALGHAAVCLRDPPVLFLLAHAVRCSQQWLLWDNPACSLVVVWKPCVVTGSVSTTLLVHWWWWLLDLCRQPCLFIGGGVEALLFSST